MSSFSARVLAAISSIAVVCSCTSFGPVGVDPPGRGFDGLQTILDDLPSGGTLDVFLVHGMRVEKQDTYGPEIQGIVQRLGLQAVPSDEIHPSDATHQLIPDPPTVIVDGVRAFTDDEWKNYGPRVTVTRYRRASDDKHVNFYGFEYWQLLALMKCRFVIAPDTRVVGTSKRSAYCAENFQAPPGPRLSSSSDYGNQLVKTEIMEFGLMDAMIAISDYRKILRQAVTAMLKAAYQEARGREGLSADPGDVTAVAKMQRFAASGRTRIAFLSESLGSYVVHDALNGALSGSDSAAPHPSAPEPSETAQRVARIAPQVIICGASQLHMFANQLALLRFSELTVSASCASGSEGSSSAAAALHEAPRAHFFRGCPSDSDLRGAKSSAPAHGGEFGAEKVVAYHEPNDLLTYYTSDRPGYVGAQDESTTNVVVPYTTQWIWGLAADPITAHVGQPGVPRVMDMLVCGRSSTGVTQCPNRSD